MECNEFEDNIETIINDIKYCINDFEKKISNKELLTNEEVEILLKLIKTIHLLRDVFIIKYRKRGINSLDIGNIFNLTPARISQICSKYKTNK